MIARHIVFTGLFATAAFANAGTVPASTVTVQPAWTVDASAFAGPAGKQAASFAMLGGPGGSWSAQSRKGDVGSSSMMLFSQTGSGLSTASATPAAPALAVAFAAPAAPAMLSSSAAPAAPAMLSSIAAPAAPVVLASIAAPAAPVMLPGIAAPAAPEMVATIAAPAAPEMVATIAVPAEPAMLSSIAAATPTEMATSLVASAVLAADVSANAAPPSTLAAVDVPEPATGMLMLAGLLGAGFMTRRRK